jgi:hypothetical protein
MARITESEKGRCQFYSCPPIIGGNMKLELCPRCNKFTLEKSRGLNRCLNNKCGMTEWVESLKSYPTYGEFCELKEKVNRLEKILFSNCTINGQTD